MTSRLLLVFFSVISTLSITFSQSTAPLTSDSTIMLVPDSMVIDSSTSGTPSVPAQTPQEQVTSQVSIPSQRADTVAKKNEGSKVATITVSPKRVQLLLPSLRNKAKPVYIGAGIFLGGALIDYALVRPTEASLSQDNLADRFALMNPSLLSSLMKAIGPVMVCQQTGKAAAAYKTFTFSPAMESYAWWIYGGGVFLTVMGQGFKVVGTLKSNSMVLVTGSVIGVLADLVFLSCGLYANYYFKELEKQGLAKLSEQKLSVIPYFTGDGAGLCLAWTW
ncbi:MAG: hypothetical protein JW795_08170 [Chitinivibrionales bacterium]|nr:hypothetical protein [Chitinivibrionales bacterium]